MGLPMSLPARMTRIALRQLDEKVECRHLLLALDATAAPLAAVAALILSCRLWHIMWLLVPRSRKGTLCDTGG